MLEKPETARQFKDPNEAREFMSRLWKEPENYIGQLWSRKVWGPDGQLRVEPLRLWHRQIEVLHSVRDHRLTAVRSGNGLGKTMTAAVASILFLLTHYPSFVVTSGSSWRVLEKVLWPQIRELVSSCNFQLSVKPPLQMNWSPVQGFDRWAMVSISATDRNKFAGLHNSHVMVVLEEADGVSEEFYEAAHGCAVGANDRILAIGNPHTPNGAFHRKFKSRDWNKIQIGCHEHPNVVEGREVFPGMVTREWVELMESQLGKGSPAYRARVEGEFPEEGEMTLCPLGWITLASLRPEVEARKLNRLLSVLSVDVARSPNGDETVLLHRNSEQIVRLEQHRGLKTTETTGRVIRVCREQFEAGLPIRKLIIDDTGIGGGVTDQLNEQRGELARWGVESVFPFLGGESAMDPSLFTNARSEAFWNVRLLLNPDTSTFHIPPKYVDRISELASHQLKPHASGRIQVMPKEEMIEKGFLQCSPNFADALMMSCSPLALGVGGAQSIPFNLFGR